MNLPLEDYYERELAGFGDLARGLARRYPAEAGRLIPDPARPADPHLNRFIEGFALLAGRLHHKLDSEFPELSEALLQILYPHLLAPVPSMSIAQFAVEPQPADMRSGKLIPKHTRLRTRPLGPQGEPPSSCLWRTGYPVTLWPLQVHDAKVYRSYFPTGLSVPPRTVAAVVLQLECLAPYSFADLALDTLRFHLSGDRQVIANLYGALFNHTPQVAFRSLDPGSSKEVIAFPAAECLSQVGLGPDEGLLPIPEESFLGYRILTEFMSFREKFLFVDLGGWRRVAEAGFGRKAEVIFFLNRAEENLEQGVTARTFVLGCTPIINLFSKSAEPLAMTQRTSELRIVPARNQPMATEVFSVDEVVAFDPARHETIEFQPFYRLGSRNDRSAYAFWYAPRRPSLVEGDVGTEVYLSLVESDFNPRLPAEAVLNVQTTCSNRDWPIRFQRPEEALFPEAGLAAPGRVLCLYLPTMPLRPPLRRGTYWRLLAQNNLNHVSLTDPAEGQQALQEILRLCDFTDSALVPQLTRVNQQVIEGIAGLKCRPVLGRVSHGSQIGFCRGTEVTLELDERNYVGVGLFLFACVLERFLSMYAAVNSFTQLTAKIKQAEGHFKKWPPRAANRLLQ